MRSYRGHMVYLDAAGAETGREFFSVSVAQNGARMLRAQCEMDERQLIRDVFLEVREDWTPVEAFVRLTVDGARRGSAWYRFDQHLAECVSDTLADGRTTQRFTTPEPIQAFGTHSLHNDAWTVGRLRTWQGPVETLPLVTFTTSATPDGSTGPGLIAYGAGDSVISDHGEHTLETALGSILTRHIRIAVPGVDDFDVWAAGEDCVPVRLRSDGLAQSYELVALTGDWR